MPKTTDDLYESLGRDFEQFARDLDECQQVELDGILWKLAVKFTPQQNESRPAA